MNYVPDVDPVFESKGRLHVSRTGEIFRKMNKTGRVENNPKQCIFLLCFTIFALIFSYS